jgi:hypothetical protein
MHACPPDAPRRRSRRLAVALFAALITGLWLTPSASRAADSGRSAPPAPAPTLRLPGAAARPLSPIFAAAGAEFAVPPALLGAIAYVESHWDGRGGQPNDFNQFGVMGLRAAPGGDGLRRAAALLGVDAASLQRDDTLNIRGAAALLRRLAATGPHADAVSLAPWYPIVARYSEIPDERVARSYAFSVFQLLREGLRAPGPAGETIDIPAAGALDLPDKVDPLAATPDSDDWGPAHWVAANAGNFQLGRASSCSPSNMNFIVIHDTEGSYQSAISWFQNPASGVSAHFVIRSSDGDTTQMVHAADTAYHAGNWCYNVRAVGIEHEGYLSQPGWYTTAMYNASSALTRAMADRFSIPKDHAHIIGHYQVPNQIAPAHTDPGPNWNWAGYMALVRNDAAVVARVRNTDGGFTASPGVIDPAHGWSVYSGGWNGGSAYRALSTTGAPTNSATWRASLPAAGLYDVYAFIPWVDNGRAETSSARYTVATANGSVAVTMNQKALTDAGNLQNPDPPQGEWGHLGRFNLSTTTSVALSNQTGDSALNVWFDTMMWIPAGNVPPPTAVPTTPPAPTAPPATRTATRTATPTRTAAPAPTARPSATVTQAPATTATATPAWTPGPCGMRFSDLPDTDWAYAYVSYLYCHGIIGGYSDGTFRGGEGATRGQLAKMLALGFNFYIPYPQVPTFSDVPVGSPFFYYVEAAHALGVISGYADGTFRPFAGVTRAQLSKMLVISKGWDVLAPAAPSFSDVPPTYWAFGFVETARAEGVISGYADGTFRPAALTTRAQLSRMLATTLQQPPPGTATLTPTVVPWATLTNTPTAAPTRTATPHAAPGP